MTLGNPLARVRTVEFFGVLLPGLFIVASLAFSWAAAHAKTADGLLDRVVGHLTGTPQWYPVAVAGFAAYLFGSVVRAFPVWRLDTPLAGIFAGRARNGGSERTKLLYEKPYPYPSMLAYDREQLQKGGCISPSNTGPAFELCHPHVAIDYCKEYASLRSAVAATRIQEVEGRTRMFFGMFCATAVGVATSMSFALVWMNALPLTWCALSVPLAAVFGQRLRFVRGHEARMVYYAYLIQRESEMTTVISASDLASLAHAVERPYR